MYLEELEEVSQRVGDHATQLERHDGGDAGEELLRQLRRVGVVGRHQVLPQVAPLPEQLRACWDPAAGENTVTSRRYTGGARRYAQTVC